MQETENNKQSVKTNNPGIKNCKQRVKLNKQQAYISV